MKGLFLLCAFAFAVNAYIGTRFDTTTKVDVGADPKLPLMTTGSKQTDAKQTGSKQAGSKQAETIDRRQIPAYGARSDLMEALGEHYPVSHEQHFSSLMNQQMISDGNNQFSRIHAEIQKNNEKPVVFDDESVTPIISPSNQLPALVASMNAFQNSMVGNNDVKTGIVKSTQELGASANGSPVLSTPTKYTLPTYDLSAERKALKEHQLNTEVQLHRLLHAMDMISESIYDPLNDQYVQGANEMLDAYLNDPYLNTESPLYKHIAAEHAFLNSANRGERIAEALYKQASMPKVPAQEPAKEPAQDKAALRQKTLEQNQVRH